MSGHKKGNKQHPAPRVYNLKDGGVRLLPFGERNTVSISGDVISTRRHKAQRHRQAPNPGVAWLPNTHSWESWATLVRWTGP